jgi:hypothetical protein
VDPLLPLGPLAGEQMPGPDPGTQVEDVRGRDPRLRQPADQQQLPQMPGIGPVGLRALVLALQRGRFGRLGQVHLSADTLELLDHEPPARCGLQSHLHALASVLYHHGVAHQRNLLTVEKREWLAGLMLPGAAREQLTIALSVMTRSISSSSRSIRTCGHTPASSRAVAH